MESTQISIRSGSGGVGKASGPSLWESVSAVAPPSGRWIASSDEDRVAYAARTLRHYGIAIGAAAGGHPEEIADRLVTAIRTRFPSADGACVFWTTAEHIAAFENSGHLRRPLVVHAVGPGVVEAAVAAFGEAGLVAVPMDRADRTQG